MSLYETAATAPLHPVAISAVHRIGAGLSMILFPILLFLGFVSHPNLLSLAIGHEITAWIAEWRGNFVFHLGHLLVMFAVLPILFTTMRFMAVLRGSGAWLGLIGGILAIFGAFMLAVDKGALTLTLTAFQEVPDPEFEGILPALQAMLDRDGWLWITWAYAVLPIGGAIQAIGLMREQIIPRWQGIPIVIGLALLINPDIEIISSVGAFLMCVGYVPMGIQEAARGLVRL